MNDTEQTNYGGLLSPERTCRYDGAPLKAISGEWSLEQVHRTRMVIDGSEAEEKLVALPAGSRFLVTLYRCPKCGYLEMIDEL